MLIKNDPLTRRETEREWALQPAQAEILWRHIDQLSAELERYDAWVKHWPDRRSRLTSLRQTLDAFDALARTLARQDAFTSGIVRQDFLPTLGGLLTVSALEKLCKSPVACSIEARAVERLLDIDHQRSGVIDGGRLLRGLERSSEAGRSSIAQEIGPRLILALLSSLKAPFEGHLRIEKAHRGGRPQDLHRNYVVQELIWVFREIFGKRPTTAKTGAFVRFSATILEAMGLRTSGLEAAVEKNLSTKRRSGPGES